MCQLDAMNSGQQGQQQCKSKIIELERLLPEHLQDNVNGESAIFTPGAEADNDRIEVKCQKSQTKEEHKLAVITGDKTILAI